MFTSVARTGALAHIGSTAVSGTAAAHGHDCSWIYRRRSRRIATGVRIQAFGKTHERGGSKTSPRHGAEWNSWRDAGQNRSVHHVIRALWISRVARGQFCAACVCQRVFEMPLSGGVYGGDAEKPADGVFLSTPTCERLAA